MIKDNYEHYQVRHNRFFKPKVIPNKKRKKIEKVLDKESKSCYTNEIDNKE